MVSRRYGSGVAVAEGVLEVEVVGVGVVVTVKLRTTGMTV